MMAAVSVNDLMNRLLERYNITTNTHDDPQSLHADDRNYKAQYEELMLKYRELEADNKKMRHERNEELIELRKRNEVL